MPTITALLGTPLALLLDIPPTPVPEPVPTKLALVIGALLVSCGAVVLVLRARRRR